LKVSGSREKGGGRKGGKRRAFFGTTKVNLGGKKEGRRSLWKKKRGTKKRGESLRVCSHVVKGPVSSTVEGKESSYRERSAVPLYAIPAGSTKNRVPGRSEKEKKGLELSIKNRKGKRDR